MNTLRLLLFLAATGIAYAHEKYYVIPASPLTLEEIEQEKERMRNDPDFSDFDLESDLLSFEGAFTFRDEDIRAAMPGLEEQDKKISLCSNSIMGGASRLVYLGEEFEPSRYWLKESSCGLAENEMHCGPYQLSPVYKYKGQYLNVGGRREFDEAIKVISFVESRGISGMPEWNARVFPPETINDVEKTANGYLISFGEVFCGGCVAKILVFPKFDSKGNIKKLKYIDSIKSICI